MSSIKMLTDANLITTKANFPALAHSFEYKDCDFDADTITCSVTGVVAEFGGGVLVDNSNDTFQAGTSISLVGTLLAPETKDLLVIGIAPNNSTAKLFQYGNSVNYGLNLKAGGDYLTSHVAGTDYHDFTALVGFTGANSTNTGISVGMKFTANTSEAHVYDDALASIESIAGVSGGAGLSGGLAQGDLVQLISVPSGTGIEVSGLYIFFFESGLPDDIAEGTAWMAHNKGKIYPAWYGKE